jgi:hypothetical protein
MADAFKVLKLACLAAHIVHGQLQMLSKCFVLSGELLGEHSGASKSKLLNALNQMLSDWDNPLTGANAFKRQACFLNHHRRTLPGGVAIWNALHP